MDFFLKRKISNICETYKAIYLHMHFQLVDAKFNAGSINTVCFKIARYIKIILSRFQGNSILKYEKKPHVSKMYQSNR